MTSAIVLPEDVSVQEGSAGVPVITLLSIVQMVNNMKQTPVLMESLIAKTENVFLINFISCCIKPLEPFFVKSSKTKPMTSKQFAGTAQNFYFHQITKVTTLSNR